jgi:putative SOS response-associated peptidase YedK
VKSSSAPAPVLINLRLESVEIKFKPLLSNRSAISVEGYYEWKNGAPYCIRQPSTASFFIACLFTLQPEMQFAVLTTEAPEEMQWLHHRVPCIVAADQLDLWLDPSASVAEARAALRLPRAPDFEAYAVSKLVNSVQKNTADCWLPLAAYEEKLRATGLERFFQPVKRAPAGPTPAKPEPKLAN